MSAEAPFAALTRDDARARHSVLTEDAAHWPRDLDALKGLRKAVGNLSRLSTVYAAMYAEGVHIEPGAARAIALRNAREIGSALRGISDEARIGCLSGRPRDETLQSWEKVSRALDSLPENAPVDQIMRVWESQPNALANVQILAADHQGLHEIEHRAGHVKHGEALAKSGRQTTAQGVRDLLSAVTALPESMAGSDDMNAGLALLSKAAGAATAPLRLGARSAWHTAMVGFVCRSGTSGDA